MSLPQIVALVGAAGAGKSTVADYLVNQHGYVRVKFATPLKSMMRAIGLTDEHIEGRLKEVPCALLGGRTPRHAMQTLGTEWGRDLIAPNFWVNLWEDTACRVLDEGGRIVCDDCRYPNELSMVQKHSGRVLRIVRPGNQNAAGNHSSENSLEPFYADMTTVMNDSSLPALVGLAWWHLRGAEAA